MILQRTLVNAIKAPRELQLPLIRIAKLLRATWVSKVSCVALLARAPKLCVREPINLGAEALQRVRQPDAYELVLLYQVVRHSVCASAGYAHVPLWVLAETRHSDDHELPFM